MSTSDILRSYIITFVIAASFSVSIIRKIDNNHTALNNDIKDEFKKVKEDFMEIKNGIARINGELDKLDIRLQKVEECYEIKNK